MILLVRQTDLGQLISLFSAMKKYGTRSFYLEMTAKQVAMVANSTQRDWLFRDLATLPNRISFLHGWRRLIRDSRTSGVICFRGNDLAKESWYTPVTTVRIRVLRTLIHLPLKYPCAFLYNSGWRPLPQKRYMKATRNVTQHSIFLLLLLHDAIATQNLIDRRFKISLQVKISGSFSQPIENRNVIGRYECYGSIATFLLIPVAEMKFELL